MINEYAAIRLGDYYAKALKSFPKEDILGVFLYGNHNYETSLSTDEIKCECILLPQGKSKDMRIKDIKSFFNSLLSGNIKDIESLFTFYRYINEDYENEWNELIGYRESIAQNASVSIVKQLRAKANSCFNNYKKYNNLNSLANLLRINDFLERFTSGESYENCLIPKNKEYIMEVRMGKINQENTKNIAESALSSCISLAKSFCKNPPQNNPYIATLLETISITIENKYQRMFLNE